MQDQLKSQPEGTSTAQAGDTYKSIAVSPLDGVSLQPTMIQFDYRVYQDEMDLWRRSVKRAEDLFRSESGKLSMARDAIKDMEHAEKKKWDDSQKIAVALSRAGIKLIPLRNNKGYRVVLLKRKPKKK